MTPFFMALSMFSIFPSRQVWDEDNRGKMLLWFPAVGLLIGACWFGLSLLTGLLGQSYLGAALRTVLPWVFSGAMHLDGFLDCADAHFSRADREKKLLILKDSRTGAFALIAMAVLTLFSFAAVTDLGTGSRGLQIFLFIPVISRIMAAGAVLFRKTLSESSYAKLSSGGRKEKAILASVFVLILFLSYLFCGTLSIVLLIEAVLSLLVITRLCVSFGGMSGDISGCSITVCECGALVAAAILKGWIS